MSIGGLDPQRSTAENYLMFGREARGRSAAYESLSAAVAADDLILEFLATLPPAKRQPNLLFAAARYLLGTPPAIGTLRALVSRMPFPSASPVFGSTRTTPPATTAGPPTAPT